MAKKKWETLLNEAKSLIQQSRENIYDAVCRMVEVSKDPGFVDFYGGVVDKAEACLDDLLGGFHLTFSEAELMLHYFPAKEQWKTMPLNDMLADSIVRRNAENKRDSAPRAIATRPTAKEMEQVKLELGQEREKAVELAKEVSRQVSEVDQLRAKIRDLEQENARLRGRIEELERMVRPDVAMA